MANLTTSAFIDAILLRTENQTSTDAANSPRRTRILEWSQQLFEEVWNLRPWSWTMDTATITVAAAANSVALPSDFQEFGPEGGAWQATGITNPRRLQEVNPQIVQELQNGSQSFSIHQVFAVFDRDDNVGTQEFQVGKCSSSTNFTLLYKRLAPTLVDATDSTNNLQQIPASWHYSVLLPGVQALSARSKGHQGLEQDYMSQYRRGLERMIAQESRRRSSVQRMGRPPRRSF